MLSRLRELDDDLVVRRGRAVAEGWLGEIDGLELTLRLLREKQAAAGRLRRDRAVELGMPHLRIS